MTDINSRKPLALSSKPDVVRHRNKTVSDADLKPPAAASGSESTEDFSSFRAIPTVQKLVDLYSERLPNTRQHREPVYENSPKNQAETSAPQPPQCVVKMDAHDSSKVEASRVMLEKNLERLIAQQGMDAISQLTHEMTPGNLF